MQIRRFKKSFRITLSEKEGTKIADQLENLNLDIRLYISRIRLHGAAPAPFADPSSKLANLDQLFLQQKCTFEIIEAGGFFELRKLFHLLYMIDGERIPF